MRCGNKLWLATWCLGSVLAWGTAYAQQVDAPPDKAAEKATDKADKSATDKAAEKAIDEVREQVDELIPQLGADTIGERDLAETNLVKLAGLDAIPLDDFLSLLPADNVDLPPNVRERLTSIRATLELRRAKLATAGTKVSVTAANWKLSELLEEISKQTGNSIVDARENFGQEKSDPSVTLIAQDLPFWAALDQALDQAKLDTYGYGGEQRGVQLMMREPGMADRYGRACYVGPFRLEPTDVMATRSLRNAASASLNLSIDIAWEPNVRPIVLGLPIDSVTAEIGEGKALTPTQPGRVFNVEVEPDAQSTQFVLPFELPERSATEIEHFSGVLLGLIPGKQAEFTFTDLRGDKSQVQKEGGVSVTLERVAKNNEVWEVHMRLELADANDALASHRNWVFGNTTYLVDKEGNTIEHVGFETTMQSDNAVGVAYLFDLPNGVEGLKWVYKTPAAIVQQQFPFTLENIKLP